MELWCKQIRPELENLTAGSKPKALIKEMSDKLLEKFNNNASLVNTYDVYEQLLTYWNETMQDDCYLIASDGWIAEPYTPQPTAKKGKTSKEKRAATPEDIVCDLLPVSVVTDEYFSDMKAAIQVAEEKLAEDETAFADLLEEQTDNYLDASSFADDKLNDGNVKKRLKTLDKKADKEEIIVLENYLLLKEHICATKQTLKMLKYNLLLKLVEKYAQLTESEIKRLVIEKKWFATLSLRLDCEMQRVSQSLNSRLIELKERYEQTLPEINTEVELLEAKVIKHLEKMGFSV
jgi:type I restriction enzyme M protein